MNKLFPILSVSDSFWSEETGIEPFGLRKETESITTDIHDKPYSLFIH